MLTYKEINEFLSHFNSNSYNKKQIGSAKNVIIAIYEHLTKQQISKENVDILIKNIAYLNKDDINIPLFVELLTKSLGYINEYGVETVIKIVKEIHDIYYDNSNEIEMSDYVHESEEERIKELFLDRNNKYLEKDFTNTEEYINSLKLAAAIKLDQKDYKEFMIYINDFKLFKNTYSPVDMYKTYLKIRTMLKDEKLLFWDILFGNEYIVSLIKNNASIKDMFKANIYNKPKEIVEPKLVQLDIFSYDEEEPSNNMSIKEEIKTLQISTIFNSKKIPELKEDKSLIDFFDSVVDKSENLVLPKLKNKVGKYKYNIERQ